MKPSDAKQDGERRIRPIMGGRRQVSGCAFSFHLSPCIRNGSSLDALPPQLEDKILIDENQSYASANDQLAREMFTRALNRCGGNVSKAAEELGMDRTGLSKAIRRLGIRL